ncbi:hypothetical protein PT974_11729 [Cladobotryum mycophilum]|uniref:Uncharacterized protein n=1 Tax=Cladobotryum mycophilum TaxID=491253 RepID=A0ABR0S633_9HYPO
MEPPSDLLFNCVCECISRIPTEHVSDFLVHGMLEDTQFLQAPIDDASKLLPESITKISTPCD